MDQVYNVYWVRLMLKVIVPSNSTRVGATGGPKCKEDVVTDVAACVQGILLATRLSPPKFKPLHCPEGLDKNEEPTWEAAYC